MQKKIKIEETKTAKPFLKWAGGKTQLLQQFQSFFPTELINGTIENYYEPFLGSGAVFFYIASNYKIRNAFLSDVNEDLILTYNAIKFYPVKLINQLDNLKKTYFSYSETERENFYYSIREKFNRQTIAAKSGTAPDDLIERAAEIIFLNRTCYNGLFRINSNGGFNVPFGRYKNPQIVNESNILLVHQLLSDVDIKKDSFQNALENIKENSFVYLDPPYLPISKTSAFTSYSKYQFLEPQQIELAEIFCNLSKKKGVKLMLSNSDPHNEDTENNFFYQHYGKDGITINRVLAKRLINSVAEKRGVINELIITNYPVNK